MGTSSTSNNMSNGTTLDSMATGAKAGAANLRDDMSGVAADASDAAGGLGERAQEGMGQLSEAASDYASRFSETRDQLLEDARDYITEYPLRTLGIAAVTGFVLGRMMR